MKKNIVKHFVRGRNLFVQHTNKDKKVPLRKYLLSIGISKSEADTLTNSKGELIHQTKEAIDPYQISPQEFKEILIHHLFPVYRFVSPSLDGGFRYGFNRHDIEHIIEVTDTTLKLLDFAMADKDELIIGLVSAAAHDLGNLLSRNFHPQLSPTIFKLIFPKMKISPSLWRKIEKTILIHDEGAADELQKSIKKLKGEEKINKLRNKFGPSALALIIADKTRVGRNRISFKPKDKIAIDEDIHLEVNLLGITKNISIDGNTFTWNIIYNPLATYKEAQEMPHLFRPKSTSPGYKAIVSDDTQKRYRYNIPADHFSTWKQKFWRTYLQRNMLAVRSVFALFPGLETCTIEIKDNIKGTKRSYESTRYVIRREFVDQFESFLKIKYLPKEERQKYDKA